MSPANPLELRCTLINHPSIRGVRYPTCLDLYTYANGDPINYIDPNGRFASHIYKATEVSRISGIGAINAFSSICANYGLTSSKTYEVGSFDLPNGSIGLINGINNKYNQAIMSAEALSQYAQGAKVYGTYNATNSVPVDILECIAGHIGIHTPPVQFLKNKWNYLIATYGADAKFLEVCHSGGANPLKNALETSPEFVRQRIIVLAINPSVIIPRKLCYDAHNYVSRRDFVTHLDIVGSLKYGNEMHVLEPHPDAHFWDHELLSPTFRPTIQYHITNYVENYGGLNEIAF